MAEFRPNPAQTSAINEEGKNILVSAGAGSGKTTVLVERVVRMIIEEGVSIDSLIIVTFTKAAAANMKEKIYKRIRAALADETLPPEKREHLMGQQMRVFSARISTIDSLCMEIVRENFQYVDIDPAFRIADEAEVNLLMQDVLADLIESHYALPTEQFLNFVNYYTDKNDAKLDDIILTLYKYSQSHPEPERWIENAVGSYLHAEHFGSGEFEEADAWLLTLGEYLLSEEETLKNMALRGIALCDANWGPYPYRENFETVLEQLNQLEADEIFDNKIHTIKSMTEEWKSLPRAKKSDEIDAELREAAKALYGDIRKKLKELQDKFFYQDLESMHRDMGRCADVAKTIADLTLEFTRKLNAAKRDRQIADFNDVNHFALQVLMRRDADGNLVYTDAADSIAHQTKEIIVDEYQDTNRMQDALIEALSSARFGRPNVFMVGDVKQSIYGFRMACPDLFIEKYNSYTDDSELGKRIILGDNYRSRREVVDFINFVFEKIMLPSVGGIDYTDGNQMSTGADYPQEAVPGQMIPEVLFVDGSGSAGKNAESYEIARKIEEIIDSYYVKDEQNDGELRKAGYSDIAILTRKTNNPKLEKMLTDRHIPVRKSSSKGFFGSFEIRLALDLLKIIDNPYQDIPLAAVLLSPIAGLDANALARIKTGFQDNPFRLYPACHSYCEDHTDETAEKLSGFFAQLERWQKKALYFSFDQFLREVLEESGLNNMCTAMTYGEGRRANLDALRNLAANYQNGSYTGLFNFLRYLDAMQKGDMDLGTAEGISGAEDAVTMMTIHKSKGLEFPIVIIADGGKQISDLESSSPIYLDDEIGVGIEYRNTDTRIKKKTLMMETIAAKKKTELFAEEIRLLYVAMSRAKEKLVITGSSGTMTSHRKVWEGDLPQALPDAGSIRKDNSYLLLLADAMKCASEEEKEKFRWTIKDLEEIEIERAEEIFDEQAQRNEIEKLIAEAGEEGASDAGIYAYQYPFESATRTNIKVTASQMENHETDRDSEDEARYQKRFSGEGLTGAERGNAYHKFFELLDYAAVDAAMGNADDALQSLIAGQISSLQESGHLTEEAAEAVETEKIVTFLHSDIGERMRKAALSGKLKREQQFVMSAEIEGNPDGLVQGIIDAFFVEEAERGKHVILVDYKTDRGRGEDYFIRTYQGQQEQYAKAIEAALGLPVTEKILYSVELGKEIYLP
ncbi:MAG: helicase-exonuclease AddAB subunit AddA [Lachnospiraceae bacterium]|nr:helicase-exonuclease AddAB subunit AddA [Lachnospiraceae bacterium]